MISKQQAIRTLNEKYSLLKEGEKATFSRLCNKLLQVNYITQSKIGDINSYRFILAYKEVFEAFFAICDFELNIHRADGVVFIKNENQFNRLRLKKDESILLIIIRILYQEKRALVTLNENVEVTLEELHNEVSKVGFLEDKRISKDRLKICLMLFRNYNIIDYIDNTLKDSARIKLYPTIIYALNLVNIKEAQDRLDQYIISNEGAEGIEEINEN